MWKNKINLKGIIAKARANKRIKMIFQGLFILIAVGIIMLVISSVIIENETRVKTYTMENIQPASVAIVFGAGLRWDGTPTLILRDRLDTAIQLYQKGMVSKILVSGDNRFVDYNEPGSMYIYVLSKGIPPQDVVRDYAGRRTYDTCYRAKAIFQVSNAILVTQAYHLPRALYLCNHLGLNAQGIASDNSRYSPSAYTVWTMREWVARAGALWDIWIQKPLPVLGQSEPIITEKITTK